MPRKELKARAEYNRQWRLGHPKYENRPGRRERHRYTSARRYRQLRLDFFAHHFCEICGSIDALELHHEDRTTKIGNCVWGWSQTKRDAEIAKCSILCDLCHRKVTAEQIRKIHQKLTFVQAQDIRQLYANGSSIRALELLFRVSNETIRRIVRKLTYQKEIL